MKNSPPKKPNSIPETLLAPTIASKTLSCFQFFGRCLKILGNLVVLLVLSLLLFNYWAVVGYSYGSGLFSQKKLTFIASVVVVSVYSILTIFTVWAYFAAVLTDPGKVPSDWHPFSDEQQARQELERMSYSDYYFDHKDPRRPRYCKRCQAWKPERAHHCNALGRCVLRMDHYCFWILNCVGLLNYKFFLQFMLYSCLMCLLAVPLLVKPLIEVIRASPRGNSALVITVTAILDMVLGIGMAGLVAIHAQLVFSNYTTIEMYEKNRVLPWPYNMGWKKNFEEVFGRSKVRWIVPVLTKEERRAMVERCLNTRLLSPDNTL